MLLMKIQCKIKFSFSKVSSQTIWECLNHNHTYNLCIHAQKTSNYQLSLFTGRQVWAFSGNNVEPGYPKTLNRFGLPSFIKNVSAAIHDKNSGKTLLFVGRFYYRLVKCQIINKNHWNLLWKTVGILNFSFFLSALMRRQRRWTQGIPNDWKMDFQEWLERLQQPICQKVGFITNFLQALKYNDYTSLK